VRGAPGKLPTEDIVMLGMALALTLAAPADLSLVGLVVAGSPERCVAVLRSEGRTRVASPGDAVFGGRLVVVGTRGVSIDFDGERVEVTLSNAPMTATAVRPADEPAPPPSEDGAPGPPRSLDRRDVERRLSLEIPRILAETTAVPVMENGRVTGIALTRIAEGSLLTEAGLLAGDVLTQINDTVIDGLPTLIGLYPRLQSARELRAVVLRNGVPFTINVSLR
jgi:type II secretory pathway component PulC